MDVPARLRALALGTVDEARTALFDLGAGIFHQGGYYPSAAPCVPFLIEIAGAPTPIREEVLLFLADMSGAPPDTSEPFDPFVFRSMPGAPDYPEATQTIEAIARGLDTYIAALDAPEPRVRGAAGFLLSRVANAPDALRGALAKETEALVGVGLRLALARCGASLPDTDEPIARAVTRVLTSTSLDVDTHAAFALLLDQPLRRREELPFFEGDLSALALARLRPMLTDDRARALVQAALEARLGRGETFVEAPMPPSIRVTDDEATPRVPVSFAEYGTDRPLRGLVAALAEAAFGTTPRTTLRTREELDARQRAVLGLTITHGVPVPVAGVPWITTDAMRRFLEGGGALDRELDVGGVRAPLFVHLSTPTHAQDAPRVTEIVQAIVVQSTDEQLFDLVVDLFADGYDLAQGGYLPSVLASAMESLVFPRLRPMRARLETFAEALVEDPSGPAARFALTPWIDAKEPSPPHLDRVAASAVVFLRAEGVPWLTTFPEPRRSRLIARFGNPYLLKLFEGACERLPEALLEAFVDPACSWFEHDAEGALARVSTETLEQARSSLTGRRARIVGRVLRARTGEGRFVLSLRPREGALDVSLVDWTGATRLDTRWDAQPGVEELARVAAITKDVIDAHVTLTGEIDHTTEYRVMRLFGEAGFRGAITNGRGSTMTVGRRDA